MDSDGWRQRGRYLAGLPLLALFGVYAFVRGMRVPLLGWIDLAIHEAGHVFAMPLPDLATAAMGSGSQVAVPLLLAAVFWWREHDPLGAAVCLGWAGTSLQDASVYIADAPFQRLPLIGGHHDWAWVLGPRGFDALGAAGTIARVVLVTGMVVWAGGVVLCLLGPRLARDRAALSSRRAHANLSPPPAGGPRPDAVGATRRPVGPHHPGPARPGAAGGLDADGSSDPPRARVVW